MSDAPPPEGATPSQTIGPFFRPGTEWLHTPRLAALDDPDSVTLAGTVRDGERAPVPDAMVELWQPATGAFGRCLVDGDGGFAFTLLAAGPLDVTVFARGPLNRLVTRMWLPGDPTMVADPVWALLPDARRSTVVAVGEGPRRYRWDITLQGDAETVFLVF